MRPSDLPFAAAASHSIEMWEASHGFLPGLTRAAARDCFIRQLVDSDRRRRYVEYFRHSTRIGHHKADPGSGVFSPLAAAVWHGRRGDIDEALWLVFLSVHFGRHPKALWRYTENVYGRLGSGRWDWPSVATDTLGFREWLAANGEAIKGEGPNGFGNHRKHESLGDHRTGKTVDSYVAWIGRDRGHRGAFTAITGEGSKAQGEDFEYLFDSMRAVFRFGRLARFDYLTMAARLGLTTAIAGRPYLPGSTGPLDGARLLFGTMTSQLLEETAVEFGNATGIQFAVLEDALCNWQKSPDAFKRVRV